MPSTYSVCGTFTERFPDYGQCWPRRGKRNCTEDWDNPDAETPGEVCSDPNSAVESTPSLVPPYRIISTVFDEDCEPILDENNDPITGPTF